MLPTAQAGGFIFFFWTFHPDFFGGNENPNFDKDIFFQIGWLNHHLL